MSLAVAEWWLRHPPGFEDTRSRLVHAYRHGEAGTACGLAAGQRVAPSGATDRPRCVVCRALVDGDEGGVRAVWGEAWREKLGL